MRVQPPACAGDPLRRSDARLAMTGDYCAPTSCSRMTLTICIAKTFPKICLNCPPLAKSSFHIFRGDVAPHATGSRNETLETFGVGTPSHCLAGGCVVAHTPAGRLRCPTSSATRSSRRAKPSKNAISASRSRNYNEALQGRRRQRRRNPGPAQEPFGIVRARRDVRPRGSGPVQQRQGEARTIRACTPTAATSIFGAAGSATRSTTFSTASKLDPRSPLYHFGAGRALAGSENYTSALNFYDEALKRGPNDGKTLSRARRSAGEPAALGRSARQLRSRARARPARVHEKYFAFAGRGYVSLVMARLRNRHPVLRPALDVNPAAWNVMMWRGYAYERRGQKAR